MPTYRFRNKKTKKEFEDFMSISAMEAKLKEDSNLQLVPSAPGIVSSVAIGRSMKPSDGFRDVLRKAKKAHPLGNVNTF